MTVDISAHDLGRTYDCRKPNCDQPARTNRGLNAYLCDEHTVRRHSGNGQHAVPAQPRPPTPAAARPAPAANGTLPSVAAELANLNRLAKNVDRLRAKQAKLTRDVLAARAIADKAEREYRQALRQAIGGA